jgi:hypothetical protein
MNGFTLSVIVDPAVLARAQSMQNWQPTLQAELAPAIDVSLQNMATSAIGFCYANFMNPGGALESNFTTQGPMIQGNAVLGYLVNDSPYAWRREFGFSGMTDRLGRYYANDPGIAYMENTLMADMSMALQNVQAAVQAALAKVGAV